MRLGSSKGWGGLSWLKAGSHPVQAIKSLLHPQPFPLLAWAFPIVKKLVCVTTLDSSSYHLHLGKLRLRVTHSPLESERAWGIRVRPLSQSPSLGLSWMPLLHSVTGRFCPGLRPPPSGSSDSQPGLSPPWLPQFP